MLVYSRSESVNSLWGPYSLGVLLGGGCCLDSRSLYFNFICISVLPARKYTACVSGTHGGEKRVPDSRSWSCQWLWTSVWVLGNKPSPLQKQQVLFTVSHPSSPWFGFVCLSACLFFCFLRQDLMYPRLTMKFWSSLLCLPSAHYRDEPPHPRVLTVRTHDSSSASVCLFSVFASGFGGVLVFILVPVSIPPFHNWDYRVAPGALAEITVLLRQNQETFGQLGNVLLLWREWMVWCLENYRFYS